MAISTFKITKVASATAGRRLATRAGIQEVLSNGIGADCESRQAGLGPNSLRLQNSTVVYHQFDGASDIIKFALAEWIELLARNGGPSNAMP
jgi:hypothetical protein